MRFRKLVTILLLLAIISLAIYYFIPYKKIASQISIDKIIVYKSQHQLLAFSKGRLVKTFTISIGKNPNGDKEYEGDYKTPEGSYTINAKNPNSGFFKNLGISYPNISDIEEAKNLGKRAGGDVKIHGLKNGLGFIGRFHRWCNWTNGCIALTNEEMQDLFEHTPLGTPIIIKP